MTKATIHYNGLVVWKPPAIYKSLCPIDVEFFPFDEQMCILKIGSWSYDGYSVDIKHVGLSDDAKDFETITNGYFYFALHLMINHLFMVSLLFLQTSLLLITKVFNKIMF